MSRRKERKNHGFTLAEMLIVVAITLILAAVAFTAVIQHQRSLRLTEADNIAREIYQGAQNHLTAAESGGTWENVYSVYKDDTAYLGEKISDPNNPVTVSNDGTDHDYRTLSVTQETAKTVLESTALKYILPYGSIEETIRSGSSYVIEYDALTAQVYGVFYSTDPNFDNNDVIEIDANNGRDTRDYRKHYEDSDGKKYAVGYYGGAVKNNVSTETVETAKPKVTLLNEERLILKVEYKLKAGTSASEDIVIESADDSTQMVSYVTGWDADASKNTTTCKASAITIKTDGDYNLVTQYYILDSIVDGQKYHFGKQFPALNGRNIKAVVTLTFDNSKKTTGTSNKTNSLFAANSDEDTVRIANARHLENLSNEISGINENKTEFDVSKAIITDDISWENDFFTGIDKENSSEGYNLAKENDTHTVDFFNGTEGDNETYYGVVNNTLSQVKVSKSVKLSDFTIAPASLKDSSLSDSVGLFSQIDHDVTITNLILNDFTIHGRTDAEDDSINIGTLLGSAADHTYTIQNIYLNNMTIDGYAGSTGGLIGLADGSSTAVKASHIVIGGTNTITGKDKSQCGGFIGALKSGSEVTLNYSSSANMTIDSDCEQSGGIAGAVNGKASLTVKDTKVSDLSVSRNGNNGTAQQAGGFIGVINGENNTSGTASVQIENSSLSESSLTAGLPNAVQEGGLVGVAGGNSSLTIENSYVQDTAVGGKASVIGGLIGQVNDQTTVAVENSYFRNDSSGAVIGTVSNPNHLAGGIIGLVSNAKKVTISNSYVRSANGTISSFTDDAGGIIARIANGTVSIDQTYVSVKQVGQLRDDFGESATEDNSNNVGVGGFIGNITGGKVTVTKSYAAGRTVNGSYQSENTDAYEKNIYGGLNNRVGGFIGKNSGNLTVKDSYTTASVYVNSGMKLSNDYSGHNVNAAAGGFIGYSDGTLTLNNVYSTGLVQAADSSTENSGAFAGYLNSVRNISSSFAIDGINGDMSLVGNDATVSNQIQYESNGSGVFRSNSQSASPYDSTLGNTYGFNALTGMTHVGDWPTAFTKNAGKVIVVYYEKIGDTYYYHGYELGGTEIKEVSSSTPLYAGTDAGNKDLYVSEDGYAVLVRSDLVDDNNGFISSSKVDYYKAGGGRKKITDIADQNDTLAGNFGLSGYTAYQVDKTYFTPYDGNKNNISSNQEKNAYLTFSLKGTSASQTIYMNPYFGDCISTAAPDITEYQIRSKSQYVTLMTQSNMKNYLGTAGFVINQTMDIDLSGEASYSYQNKINAVYQGSAPDGYLRKIKNINGTYGFAKSISNSGTVQNLNFVNTTAVSLINENNNGTMKNLRFENPLFTGCGLVSSVNNGTIDGVTILNAAISGSAIADRNGNDGVISSVTISTDETVKKDTASAVSSSISGNGLVSGNNNGKVSTVTIANTTIGQNGICDTNNENGRITGVQISDSVIAANGITATNKGLINKETDSSGTERVNTITNTVIGGNGVVNRNETGSTIAKVYLKNIATQQSGFAGYNNGYILSCQIYSDEDVKSSGTNFMNQTGYGLVQVGLTTGTNTISSGEDRYGADGSSYQGTTAGFVTLNDYLGIIYSCSFTGSVYSNNIAAGFYIYNLGDIYESYANASVNIGSSGSARYAAGFGYYADLEPESKKTWYSTHYHDHSAGVIQVVDSNNVSTIVSDSAYDASTHESGFIFYIDNQWDQSRNKYLFPLIKNCYSAVWSMQTQNGDDSFIVSSASTYGHDDDIDAKICDNATLNVNGIQTSDYAGTNSQAVTHLTASQLCAQTDLGITNTAGHPYNDLITGYSDASTDPFPMPHQVTVNDDGTFTPTVNINDTTYDTGHTDVSTPLTSYGDWYYNASAGVLTFVNNNDNGADSRWQSDGYYCFTKHMTVYNSLVNTPIYSADVQITMSEPFVDIVYVSDYVQVVSVDPENKTAVLRMTFNGGIWNQTYLQYTVRSYNNTNTVTDMTVLSYSLVPLS